MERVPFDVLVEQNRQWLYSYLYARVRNRHAAEDLLQEVFIRAWRAYDGYSEQGFAHAWLRRIAHNIVSNYHRTQFRLPVQVDGEPPQLSTTAPDPEAALLQRAQTQRLYAALAQLSIHHRTVITLRYLHGQNLAQTAQRLGIPHGTVKSRTHTALNALKGAYHIMLQTEETRVCQTVLPYLFIYAANLILPEHRQLVESHLPDCPSCRKVAETLVALLPNIPRGDGTTLRHFNIEFPEQQVTYSTLGIAFSAEKHAVATAELLTHDGKLSGACFQHASAGKLAAIFDGCGTPIAFSEQMIKETHDGEVWAFMQVTEEQRAAYTTPVNWDYHVYLDEPSDVKPCPEAPTLFRGKTSNRFGMPVQTGLYMALPTTATNIRITRGNGILATSAYPIAYADRYTGQDEAIALEYTYINPLT